MLQARMHADGAAVAADEALRLLLGAGYSGDSDGMRAMLVAAGRVAIVCGDGHATASAASSSYAPAPWCGVVSTAIKLARRVTCRLCRTLQRPHELPGGATGVARSAAVDEQSDMLAELLGLAAGAAGALCSSADALIQAPRFTCASVAVSR